MRASQSVTSSAHLKPFAAFSYAKDGTWAEALVKRK